MKRYNLKAMKRMAIDGKIWWVAYDEDIKDYATITTIGRYKTKKDCLQAIEQHKKLMKRILNN